MCDGDWALVDRVASADTCAAVCAFDGLVAGSSRSSGNLRLA
jgi:hypothetical protein